MAKHETICGDDFIFHSWNMLSEPFYKTIVFRCIRCPTEIVLVPEEMRGIEYGNNAKNDRWADRRLVQAAGSDPQDGGENKDRES